MLDTGDGALAVGTAGSLGGLGDGVGNELSAGGSDGAGTLGLGVVGVSYACDTVIRHFELFFLKRGGRNAG